jgi:hypothetical protein
MEKLAAYLKNIADIYLGFSPKVIGFALGNYAIVFLFLFVAFFTGRIILKRFQIKNSLERLIFSLSTGIGAIGTLGFLFGFIGLLRIQYFVPFLLGALFILYTYSFIHKTEKGSIKEFLGKTANDAGLYLKSKKGIITVIFIILIFVMLLPLASLPVYPSTGFDDGTLHLLAAKTYEHTGKIVIMAEQHMPTYSIFMEVIYAILFFFTKDGITCQILQLCLFFLTGLTVFSISMKYFNGRVGLLAAALWFSSPLVLWQGIYAYIDISFTFFIIVAVYALLIYIYENKKIYLSLCGALLGIASSIKYNGLAFCAIIGLLVIVYSIRRKSFKSVFIYGIPIIVFLLPCFGFNYIETGNPVFPFYPQIFGSKVWPLQNSLDFMNSITTGYGVPKTVVNFLKLPILVVSNKSLFFGEGVVNITFSLLLPFVVILGLRKSRISQVLVLIGTLFMLFWFTGSQVLRYIGVVLPLFSIPSAVIVDKAIRNYVQARFQYVSALLVSMMLFSCASGWGLIQSSRRPGIPVTETATKEYLNAYMFPYEGISWLNNHDSDSTCYQLFAENLAFYADFTWIGSHFSYNNYLDIITSKTTGRDLYESLKSCGADYFLYTDHRYQYQLPKDDFFKKHFVPVWAEANGILFKLYDEPHEEDLAENIIKNPHFEALDNDGKPLFWFDYATTTVKKENNHTAVIVSSQSTPYQIIDYLENKIKADSLLKFSISANSASGNGSVEIYISWMNNDRFITSSTIKFNLNSSEDNYVAYMTAKNTANRMIVFLRSQTGEASVSDISLNSVSFSEN